MKNIIVQICLILLSINCISQEWITYTNADNKFKIKFPGQPEIMNLKLGYGIDSTQIFSFMDITKAYTYNLTVHDVSKEMLKPEFNEEKRLEVVKGLATSTIGLIGKILSTEEISFTGYPGIFVTGEITQAIKEPPYPPVYVKSYLVDNRIYQLMVSCSFENKENKQKDVFFDSFEIVKK